MKLRTKLTAIAMGTVIAVLSACLVTYLLTQESALRRADEERAQKALSLYCMNVVSVVNADSSKIQSVTLRSTVDYYFTTYAQLLQGAGTFYSLSQGGVYLFNTCPYNPLKAYGTTEIQPITAVTDEQAEIPIVRIAADDGAAVVGACSLSVAGQTFQAYICMDVTQTEKRIVQMRWLAACDIFIACVLVTTLVAGFMRRALRPVQKLIETAARIAGGEYHRRTALSSRDEIGQLSSAFDRMADSVEDKIRSLDSQLQKNQLLLGALAHELKTPMTAVVGYSDSLLHMPISEEQRIACAQKINNAGRHTEALCLKLMELVGLSGDARIDMKRIPACRLAEALRESAGPGVVIRCEAAELYGDETLLISMAGNLIDNAVKASPEGAEVDVSIRGGAETAQITVSDSGRGIPPESIGMVTEPFFRVDKARSRKHGGAGLGLAICKLIAERHGGRLFIESQYGKGTRVTVTLLQLDDKSHTS